MVDFPRQRRCFKKTKKNPTRSQNALLGASFGEKRIYWQPFFFPTTIPIFDQREIDSLNFLSCLERVPGQILTTRPKLGVFINRLVPTPSSLERQDPQVRARILQAMMQHRLSETCNPTAAQSEFKAPPQRRSRPLRRQWKDNPRPMGGSPVNFSRLICDFFFSRQNRVGGSF